MCDVLGKNKINIRALTIAESNDFGVLRMVVDKPDDALAALKKANFVATLTDVVAVEEQDVLAAGDEMFFLLAGLVVGHDHAALEAREVGGDVADFGHGRRTVNG